MSRFDKQDFDMGLCGKAEPVKKQTVLIGMAYEAIPAGTPIRVVVDSDGMARAYRDRPIDHGCELRAKHENVVPFPKPQPLITHKHELLGDDACECRACEPNAIPLPSLDTH